MHSWCIVTSTDGALAPHLAAAPRMQASKPLCAATQGSSFGKQLQLLQQQQQQRLCVMQQQQRGRSALCSHYYTVCFLLQYLTGILCGQWFDSSLCWLLCVSAQ